MVGQRSATHIGHAALGLVPVVGEVADLANAAWYAAEGNYADAALSAAGAIPFMGWGAAAAKGAKYAYKGIDAAKLDQRVHNLTVAGIHTYHVTTTNTDHLVHNTCGPAMLDDASEAYVRRKYMPGGADVTPDKSVFDKGVDIDDLVERSNSCACRGPNASGFYERDVDAGRVIGRLSEDAGGLPTTWYRVVQDRYGGVITMHPILRPGR